MDDFKPVNKNVDGVVGGPKPQMNENEDQTNINTNLNNTQELTDLGAVTPSSPINEVPLSSQLPNSDQGEQKKDKKTKSLKIWLVVLTLLFIAASVFAVYQYFQAQDYKKKIDNLNVQVEKLKSENYDLNYKTKDTSVSQDLVKKDNEALKMTNTQLRAACGSACKDIQ